MESNSHVRTVDLASSSACASLVRIRNLNSSSSCALRWALAPAAASNSWTRLVRNSSTRFDVLCTRLQLLLLHGLDKTAGALPVAVHVSPQAARAPAFGQALRFPKALSMHLHLSGTLRLPSFRCLCINEQLEFLLALLVQGLLLSWCCLSGGGVLCGLIALVIWPLMSFCRLPFCCQPSLN